MKPEVQCLLEYYTGEKFSSEPQYGASGMECGGGVAGFLRQAAVGFHGFFGQSPLEAGFVGRAPLGFAGFMGQAPQETHGQLNAQQRQQIRDISTNLKTVADSLRIRPRTRVSAERVIQHENLDRSEMRVINNICSERRETTVSRIANYLEEKLTPRTLRAAFRFLCYSVSSVPEELAVVCELSRLTVSKIRQIARSDSAIYDVINEFVEERLHEMY